MLKLDDIIHKEERTNPDRFRTFLKRAAIVGGMMLGTIFSANAQYNVHIKANTLDQTATGTPISGAVISKDQGDVVKVTDSNGEAILTDVGGSMSIKALHPDYKQFEQTFNITSDTTLYFAMPKTIRLGPWGTDTLNADWWKYIYYCSASQDPYHWKQIIPVNVRIEGASVADSLNIVKAMNAMKNSTGYDLFKIISPSASKDTTYTIYMNTGPNSSQLYPDINWIAYTGYSKITNSDTAKITHEIVKSQYGWPTSNIPVPTNANPITQTRPPWQPLDGSYLSLKIEQDFRKKGGKQSLMIFNMQNYVALGNVGIVPVTSPANNSVDLDTLLSIIGTKDTNAIWYDYKITSDSQGNNIIISQNGVDRPRTNAILESGKTYFIFERARNSTSTGAWSTPNQITTKAKTIVYPGQALIGAPNNNATKVGTPVPYSVSAQNANSYRILAARDLAFAQMLKDTVVNVTNPHIPLPNGTLVYTKAIGINSNGSGPESVVVMYTTIKAKPGPESITFPLNNATEVTQPTNYTNSVGANAEKHEWQLLDVNDTILLDTIPISPGFTYDKLPTNKIIKAKVRGVNTDQVGDWSPTVIYTMFDFAPSTFDISLINNATVAYTNGKLAIPSTPATDVDNSSSELSKNFHVTGSGLDTIIHANNIETIYLDSARLQLDTPYTVSAEVTDGKKTTQANEVKTFRTKKPTGIDDVILSTFKMYPNPTSQYINIELGIKKPMTIDIELYDINGKLLDNIHEHVYNENYNGQVDMSKYKTGMYIMQIHSDNELVKTAKIIKK